jgi:hypothetical protein
MLLGLRRHFESQEDVKKLTFEVDKLLLGENLFRLSGLIRRIK